MPETPPHDFRLPLAVASASAAAATFIIAAVDAFTVAWVNIVSLYSIPVILCAAALHRRLMWLTTVIVSLLALVLFTTGSGNLDPQVRQFLLINRLIACGGLLVLAGILHGFVGTYRKLETGRSLLMKRREELEAANVELSAREEEISTQNEELQNQTEELERQTEELRVANEELERRERALDVLLSLSRSLTAELSRRDTLDRICRTLGELIDHGTAAAILLRHGDELRIECHQNFGGAGPRVETIPVSQSFTGLIREQNRTGYLEDVSLRPDLHLPQPRAGPAFQSVLATPLRVNGDSVGTLEAYSTEKRTWSEDQIALIESLAAQTSTSLQAAELYERIEQERQRLQAVLETVPFGVMISNADLTDVRMNPAGAALRRIPASVNVVPLRDQSRWKLFGENGAVVTEENHPLARAVRDGEVIHGQEIDLLVDGRHRYTMLYSAAPIRDNNGKVIGGVCASVDITEQKRLQQELDARRREAEEASVRKTRFLAAVSHDIRTPANAISLLAELMQRTASTPALQGEIPEIAADLRNSAMTLVNLVSDVLDLTRFDSGRIELEESEFPLEALVNDECRQLGALAREKGLQFHCTLPPRPIMVRADRVKLSRILGNLISNAVKFTETGSVTIAAGASAQGGAWVRVSDTGPGIPPEYQQRIFDEFFQLKHAGSHNGGSGLGLAICRRLAQAMGGGINIESEVGKGSTFTLTLPASAIIPT